MFNFLVEKGLKTVTPEASGNMCSSSVSAAAGGAGEST
jgi:hypothetical protein